MNRASLISLLAVAVLATAPAGAGDTVTRSLSVGSEPEVRVINARGDIIVVGEGRGEIRVKAKLVDSVERLSVEERGDQVIVEMVYKDKRSGGWGSSGSKVYVVVPTDTNLRAEGVSSDIAVEGVEGELFLRTVSGDIAAESFGGKLKAGTTSGDVEVLGHHRPAWNGLESVSGDIVVTGLAGELRATTVSGDIEATNCEFERVRASVTSGSIEMVNAFTVNADFDAEAVSGDVELHMPSGWGGRVDVSTLNGSIDNCFGPEAKRVSRYGPGRVLNFEHGNGAGRIEIETVNGDVEICRN